MARRSNDLFVGTDNLTIEGRSLKHPGLITVYGNINLNKISDTPLELISFDLETDAKTGELKLLGVYDGNNYRYYTAKFIDYLLMWVRGAYYKNASLSYWNRLDPFILLKQFLLLVEKHEQIRALQRFGNISGEWDRKHGKWIIHPIIEITMGRFKFGIKNAMRSSVQFFFYETGDVKLKTVWAYDIAQLFENHLEAEATKRLKYYHKVDASAHIVDWERFDNDSKYRNDIVLLSNELDARACYDLGMAVQHEFYDAFGHFPKNLISQGALARAAVVATLYNKEKKSTSDEEVISSRLTNEISSIGIQDYLDDWATNYGNDFVKDFYCLATETYSGAYIETIRYGSTKHGAYADIASAYPGIIRTLKDLRNAKITHGKGTPPRINNSYCFIRGYVDIPEHVDFNPITIKHPTFSETNIRANGKYRASYTLRERDFMTKQGATFKDEEWYNIETKGKLSPLASVCDSFLNLRKHFLSLGSTSQYMAKIAANSLYGILYEAVDTYTENMMEFNTRDAMMVYEQLKDECFAIDEYDIYVPNQKELFAHLVDAYNKRYPQLIIDYILLGCLAIPHGTNENDFNNDFLTHVKKYIGKINLDYIANDIAYHLGHKRFMGTWNKRDLVGVDIYTVVEELEQKGIFLNGYNEVDLFMDLYNRYQIARDSKPRTVMSTLNAKQVSKLSVLVTDVLNREFERFSPLRIGRAGYRAGEFWNPIYAAIITSETRILMAEAAQNITDNGGEVILCMTDSLLWNGTPEQMDQHLYKEIKTAGYFEKPSHVKNIICLGSGRYAFESDKGKYTAKRRGLNIVAFQDADGVVVDDFNWHDLITKATKEKIDIKVRTLISPGLIIHQKKYEPIDLGRIVEENREVEIIVGKSKRVLDNHIEINELSTRLYKTKSIYIDSSVFGSSQAVDMTQPKLRQLVMAKPYVTRKERKQTKTLARQKKYQTKHDQELKDERKKKYKEIKSHGYDSYMANKMKFWNNEQINEQLRKDGKL